MLLSAMSAGGLTGLLIPLIIFIAVALIVLALVERFSPDPTITYVVKIVVFVAALIMILKALLPFLVM